MTQADPIQIFSNGDQISIKVKRRHIKKQGHIKLIINLGIIHKIHTVHGVELKLLILILIALDISLINYIQNFLAMILFVCQKPS